MRWSVADETVAVVTWIGTLVALVGLPATFMQARFARRAANAAENAVKALEDRLTLANLSFAYSQIEGIRNMVASNNASAAQVLLAPVKRTIIEVCQVLGSRSEMVARVEIARKNLFIVDHQVRMAAASSGHYKATTLTKALSGLSDFLLEHETALKFPRPRA